MLIFLIHPTLHQWEYCLASRLLVSFCEHPGHEYFRMKIRVSFRILSFSHHFSPPNQYSAMGLNTNIRSGSWTFLSSMAVLWSNIECNSGAVTLPSYSSVVKVRDLWQLWVSVPFFRSSGRCLQQRCPAESNCKLVGLLY